MKALTVKQPWAGLIAHGDKTTENRTWALPERHVGTRILIHAGAAFDNTARSLANELDDWQLTPSAIVAVATLTGCHFSDDGRCCSPWSEADLYHWTLTDATPLSEPVHAKGALGFWTPTPDVLFAVQAQLETTRA
ncbi:ASCH domain-containing protein [Streptomyces sp. NPDC059916]|uniref:ASCH domain-containing protein n=1 Tax=Streptomyces sp. NPDC059916 TaxID=3347001 RepID=UPI0036CB87A4